jgi:hypothetical protein
MLALNSNYTKRTPFTYKTQSDICCNTFESQQKVILTLFNHTHNKAHNLEKINANQDDNDSAPNPPPIGVDY